MTAESKSTGIAREKEIWECFKEMDGITGHAVEIFRFLSERGKVVLGLIEVLETLAQESCAANIVERNSTASPEGPGTPRTCLEVLGRPVRTFQGTITVEVLCWSCRAREVLE